ncbi:hypothetical protein CMO89_01520 [Candidatus Woesearchaeota archaeon]|nr:hypothetical protein [Candidatus Woesearchaeota archaeon]|tara:strand:- start:5128 stop:5454 length:327 start_codon:yes stop_codon:yes gene_type:complete
MAEEKVYPAEEQGGKSETEEEIEEDMETGEKEEDVYTEEGREKLVEDDEIEPGEEGFMKGAEGLGQDSKCRKCGKILKDEFLEKEIDGELHRFCSDKCAEEYEREKNK